MVNPVGNVSVKELKQTNPELFPESERKEKGKGARSALKSIFGGGKKRSKGKSPFASYRFVRPIPKEQRLENLEKARRAKRLKA